MPTKLQLEQENKKFKKLLKKYIEKEVDDQKPIYPRPPIHFSAWIDRKNYLKAFKQWKIECEEMDKEWEIKKNKLLKKYKNSVKI